MRVHVDDDVCAGHGVCLGLCPEVFDIDEDAGYAVVLVAEVPTGLEAAVRESALHCPSGAITLDP